MATIERRYYLAQGPDEKIVRDFFRDRLTANDACSEIAARHGGRAVTRGHIMCGVAFDGEPPKGWRRVGATADARAYYMPVARSKAGKQAKSEIQAIRIPGAMELDAMLGGPGGVFGEAGPNGGFWIFYITAEIINGKCVIHVPEQCNFEPKHSAPLKKSDYWKLKEGAQEKDAASS